MIATARLSPKYALASLILITFLVVLYGISDGDYQPKNNPSKPKSGKNSRSHAHVMPVDNVEYVTPSRFALNAPHVLEQELTDNNYKNSIAQSDLAAEPYLEFRIVHLDLKGAPPRISYFEELFPYLRAQGATGILIEYEDMFPYSGLLLEDVPAYNAYTIPDIKELLRLAKQNKLEVIPLIQTFGHLEFLLKLKQHKDMREMPVYPGSICPTYNKSIQVLHTMIDQVVHLHPNLRYLHIGCDEVYQLGKCARCTHKMKTNEWKSGQLFLEHVLHIARYIRTTYSEVMPLVWDDMFRNLSHEELSESGVSQWIEPVIWNYHPNIGMHIGSETWMAYLTNFKNIWIASAFKGATAPDQLLTNLTYHLENHMSWMAIVEQFKNQVRFRGIMMTGWQRYDHFAVLCELFPVGIPSLVLNLYYVQNYKHINPDDAHAKLADILQCEIAFPPFKDTLCNFPGSRILRVAERLHVLRIELESPHSGMNNPVARGWLSDQNVRWNFSSPHQVYAATTDVDRFKMNLAHLKGEFRQAAAEIYDRFTVEEWIEANIEPYEKKLIEQWLAREQLLSKVDWPRRPFHLSNHSDQI